MADVLVVGTGLVGTSVGLALHGLRDVALTDTFPQRLQHALDRGAGRRWNGSEHADLVLLAIPPRAIVPELQQLQALEISQIWSHVSSSQSRVQHEVETLNCSPENVCGGHPMAGSERSGPEAASARLFQGRPWVLCPGPRTAADTLASVRALAEDCGAESVEMTPTAHDAAVALVSHLPQLAASAVAAQLVGRETAVRMTAGPGLRDTTRVAASPPELWREVLADNAADIAPLLLGLAGELHRVALALRDVASGDEGALDQVVDLLTRGNAGRALVPVKRGDHDSDFVPIAVSVPDRPGQLAELLAAAAAAGVNVEDVRVEHLAGRPRGLVELQVTPAEREHLRAALTAQQWELVD